MALSGFLVPALTGALMERNRIADERDDISGGVIDAVSKHYFEDTLPIEQELIEKRTALFDNLIPDFGAQAVEAFAKLGYLDSGELKVALNYIDRLEEKNPGIIDQIKTADPNSKLFQAIYKDENERALKTIEDTGNTVAKNLTRHGVRQMADLWFNKDIKKGKLDTAQSFIFGGPEITERDIPAFTGQIEKMVEGEIEPTKVAAADLKTEIGYIPPKEPSAVETKKERVTDNIITSNKLYATGEILKTDQGLQFQWAGQYVEQSKAHIALGGIIENSRLGSGKNQQEIADLSNQIMYAQVLTPATVFNVSDSSKYIKQTLGNIYIHQDELMTINKTPKKLEDVDFTNLNALKQFIHNMVTQLDSKYFEETYTNDQGDEISGYNKAEIANLIKSQDEFGKVDDNTYKQMLSTAMLIHYDLLRANGYGDTAALFFLKAIPEFTFNGVNEAAQIKMHAIRGFQKGIYKGFLG
jgi:hypothetical protein